MSKKAKAEIADESAVVITDAVLAENQAKLDSYEKSIKAVQERRRKVIIDSKIYTYDKLSQLYGGAEGQALLDAVAAEHTLIGKLTDSGMVFCSVSEFLSVSFTDFHYCFCYSACCCTDENIIRIHRREYMC